MGSVKLTKNNDIDKYNYLRYGIGFDSKKTFLFPNCSFAQNLIILATDMGSSVHVDNKKKVILIIGKGPAQGLDDTTLTAQKKIIELILL